MVDTSKYKSIAIKIPYYDALVQDGDEGDAWTGTANDASDQERGR